MASAGDWRDFDLEGDPPWTPPEVRALFDRVARRDPERTSNGWLRVAGRVESGRDPVESVALGRGRAPEPDEATFAAAASAPLHGLARAGPRLSHFEIEVEKPTRDLAAMRPVLRLRRRSGAEVELRLPAPGAEAERGGVRVAIERVEETGGVDATRRAVRRALWGVHALALRALGAAGLLAFAVLLAPPWRGRGGSPVAAAIALTAVLVVGRVGLLALVDASSFSARSSRYVYPVVPLYGIGVLLAIREARGRWLTRASRRPRAAPRR
jgi:hypothetical protein